MPALNLPNLNFNLDSDTNKQTLEQIVDSLSKYRKELNFLLMNLDLSNMPVVEGVIDGINSSVTDIDGNMSLIRQDVNGILLATGNDGSLASFQLDINGIQSQVSNNVGNISDVTQTATDITTYIGDMTGAVYQEIITAGGITTYIKNDNNRVSQVEQTATEITTYIGAMTGVTDSYAQQIITAGGITSMVGKHIDSILAQDSAISTVEQTADSLASTVTSHTTAIEEQEIFKQSSAPAHKTNRLWLDTGVSPNIMYRSTGSSWIKASPTTASDIGLNMATYATTSSLTQTSDAINLRFTNLKALNGVETISGGVTNITQSGIKITHSGTNQYSEMRADGFIRQWEYGEAKYLNDIYVTQFTSAFASSSSIPADKVIQLPSSFRGRTGKVKLFVAQTGWYADIASWSYNAGESWISAATKTLETHLYIVSSNFNLSTPTVTVRNYLKQPWTDPGNGTQYIDYREMNFMLFAIGV